MNSQVMMAQNEEESTRDARHESYLRFIDGADKKTMLSSPVIKLIFNLYLEMCFPECYSGETVPISLSRSKRKEASSIFQMVFKYSIVSKEFARSIIPFLRYPMIEVQSQEDLVYLCLLKEKGFLAQCPLQIDSVKLTIDCAPQEEITWNAFHFTSGFPSCKFKRITISKSHKFYPYTDEPVPYPDFIVTKQDLTLFLLNSGVSELYFSGMDCKVIGYHTIRRIIEYINFEKLASSSILTRVEIPYQDLDKLIDESLFSFDSFMALTHLNLSNNKLGEKCAEALGRFLSNPACAIHTLNLSSNMLGDSVGLICQAIITAPKSIALHSLNLSSNNIGDLGCEEGLVPLLLRHSSLSDLNISSNSMTEKSLGSLYNTLSSSCNYTLRSLHINNLHPLSYDLLPVFLKSTRSLTELAANDMKLINPSIPNLGDAFFECLSLNRTLVTLDISGSELENTYHRDLLFRYISSTRTLTTLAASSCFLYQDLKESHREALFSKNQSITNLNLSASLLRGPVSDSLAAALRSPTCRLKKVDLSYNLINPRAFLEIFSSLSSNSSLEELNLSHNRVQIPKCPKFQNHTLRLLNLERNFIQNSGALSLLNALRASNSIHMVDLSDNEINGTLYTYLSTFKPFIVKTSLTSERSPGSQYQLPKFGIERSPPVVM